MAVGRFVARPDYGPHHGVGDGRPFSWLFDRRSYDDMLSHWNEVGGPYKDGLNGILKYVASSETTATLP